MDNISFSCKHCGLSLSVDNSGSTPIITPCSCSESLADIVSQHRREIEARKKQGSRQRRDRGSRR